MKVLFKTMKTGLRALFDYNSTTLVFQHSFQTFALLIGCTVSQHTENMVWNLLFRSVRVLNIEVGLFTNAVVCLFLCKNTDSLAKNYPNLSSLAQIFTKESKRN